jgi:hypothetical protein
MTTDYTLTPVTLRDHIDAETQGDRSPIQVDPIAIAEAQMDEAWFLKVMRMTAVRFARLDAHEKRMYAQRARQLAKVFGEKADMMERNSRPGPEAPEFLRTRAAL